MSTPIFSVAGLATGLDWRKMIDELLAIERRPLQALEQRKGRLQAIQGAWGELRSALQALDTSLDPLLLNVTFQARAVTSSAPTVVTAQAATGAATGSYAISVTQLAQAQVVASDQFDPSAELGFSGTFTINGKSVTVELNDTLFSLRDKINGTAGVGVTASVVEGRLVLKSATTGSTGIQVSDDPNTLVLHDLGILVDGPEGTAFKNQLVPPQDAEFSVDNLPVTRSSNTVSDVISGVTFTLQGEGSAVLEVKTDVDFLVGKIKEFVAAYNAALAKVRSYLSNQPGQAGPLAGDATTMAIEGSLRRLAYEAVAGLPGDIDSLYDIGISTSDRTGVLSVDEAKLREVLTARPEDVAQLFRSPTADSVAERLREAIRLWIGAGTGLIPGRERGLDSQIQELTERMRAMEERLELREKRLVEQFVNLERSLALLQSQAAWLERRLAALQSPSGT